MNIHTFCTPSLELFCILWAAKRFIPETHGSETKYHHLDWRGNELKPGDIIVGQFTKFDTRIKLFKSQNCTVFSSFGGLIKQYAPPKEAEALLPLAEFFSLHSEHSHGLRSLTRKDTPQKQRAILAATHLTTIFDALQAVNENSNHYMFTRVEEILNAMLVLHKKRLCVSNDAKRTQLSNCGKIAFTKGRCPRSDVHQELFTEYGVRVIICQTGMDLAVVKRSDERLILDHPDIVRIIAIDKDEDIKWRLSPDGCVLYRGNEKQHAPRDSKVSQGALANALSNLLCKKAEISLAS